MSTTNPEDLNSLINAAATSVDKKSSGAAPPARGPSNAKPVLLVVLLAIIGVAG